MEPSTCSHFKISLIKTDTKKRFQCRHCHLTITADELGKSFCPECFERTGKKHYDFKSVPSPASEKVQYRCESCGIVIAC
jgi:predicted RNA-binding Zn-ribbon protein involved in translation (DUF1610 family)